MHLIYDVKHNDRHKAKLVADGHLTNVPDNSVYSSAIFLQGLRMLFFIAELNSIEIWGIDIGNATLKPLPLSMFALLPDLNLGHWKVTFY